MYKVGIIGPESSGKSTLARYLAKRYQGVLIPEYARDYVEQKGTTEVTFDELCAIAKHQIEELEALKPNLYIFDTELIVTKVWFDYAFGHWPEWLDKAIKDYPMDLYVILYPDIPWVPDNARSNGSDAIRLELFERYKKEVEALGIEHYLVKHN